MDILYFINTIFMRVLYYFLQFSKQKAPEIFRGLILKRIKTVNS